MPQRRRKPRVEFLSRDVAINSFRASVSLRVLDPRDPYPEIEEKPWLELRGTTNEPFKSATAVEINAYPVDKPTVGTAKPPSVASIISVRPAITVVVSYSHLEFDRLWAMALAGYLKHAHLLFTKPHYGRGLVTNLSFSNEPIE